MVLYNWTNTGVWKQFQTLKAKQGTGWGCESCLCWQISCRTEFWQTIPSFFDLRKRTTTMPQRNNKYCNIVVQICTYQFLTQTIPSFFDRSFFYSVTMANSDKTSANEPKDAGSIPGYGRFDVDYTLAEALWLDHRLNRMRKMAENAERRQQKRRRGAVIDARRENPGWIEPIKTSEDVPCLTRGQGFFGEKGTVEEWGNCPHWCIEWCAGNWWAQQESKNEGIVREGPGNFVSTDNNLYPTGP